MNRIFKTVKNLVLSALALLIVISGSVAKAETITLELIDGTVYTDVEIKRSLPTTVSFRHAEGFATVPAGSLTDESLSKLGLDPANNPEFKSQREDVAMQDNLRTLKKNRATIPGGVGTGQTIQTKDITDINPVTLLVTQDGVPRRIEISTLPKDVQVELGYDAAKADEYTKAKTQAEYAASVNAAKAKAEQDKLDLVAKKKRDDAEKKAAAAAAKAKTTAPASSNTIHALPPSR